MGILKRHNKATHRAEDEERKDENANDPIEEDEKVEGDDEEKAEDEKKEEEAAEEEREEEEASAAQKAIATERKRCAAINRYFADDSAFAQKAVDEGWSLTEAKASYADVLKKQNASRSKGNSPVVPDRHRSRGTAPVHSSHGPIRTEVEDRVNELVKTGMSREKAHTKVMRSDPGLRSALIEEANTVA